MSRLTCMNNSILNRVIQGDWRISSRPALTLVPGLRRVSIFVVDCSLARTGPGVELEVIHFLLPVVVFGASEHPRQIQAVYRT